jgi:hypothetical protein
METEIDNWRWLTKHYPKIALHLAPFEKDAKKRCDKGDYWWELRACDYYEEFEKPKIVYPNICKQPEFTFDGKMLYTNQKCFIISVPDKYLLSTLNSSITFFLFKNILPKLRGDFYEPSYKYMKDFPIPDISIESQVPFGVIVDYILYSKEKEMKLHASYFEQVIDGMVFELYFPQEIKAAGKEILSHIGELQAIEDSMMDEEKMAIIEKEFNRLYDTGHPVRNHIETLDSVEEVRIIYEALK